MMMMSAPSSSFHDYLAMDSSVTKLEAMSPVLNNEDYFQETLDSNNLNSNNCTNNRSNRNTVVKRPMNAFLLWARGERKRVSSDGYGVSQTSLSKLLGETWRHMSIEEKQPFLDMAETLKRQHHIDHPDYKFKPKQRSPPGNKSAMKKNNSALSTRSSTNTFSSPYRISSSLPQRSQASSSSISNVTPHPVQSNVLAMCQAIIPITPGLSTSNEEMSMGTMLSDPNHDWFFQLTGQPQSVIVAPTPRTQTSPNSSRRAVRIQIINKHDDVVLPPPTLLPMTPPPPSSSSLVFEETTPTLVEYLVNSCNMFHLSNNSQHQLGFTHSVDDPIEYETFPDPSITQLTDLDQQYDSSGWIDTPLSSFGANSIDMVSSSPYSSYDFLCL